MNHQPPGRLQPQNPDDWPQLLNPDNPRPAPHDGDTLSPEVIRAYAVYNSRIGPIITDDVKRVAAAIDAAHFANDYASLSGQRCVVIDGPPMTGKTHAALTKALQETRKLKEQPPAGDPRNRRIPWIYTEVQEGGRGRSVLADMCRFCGLPEGKRDSAADLKARLRQIAGPVGLRGIIVDDTHGIGGTRGEDSALLADTLKGAITGIPATFVIIGANLRASGLLSGTPGEQVRFRSDWIELGNWPLPSPKHAPGPWERLVATMTHHLAFPREGQCELNRHSTMRLLAEGVLGRPGVAIEWIKKAANHAIAHDSSLDGAALDATRDTALAPLRAP